MYSNVNKEQKDLFFIRKILKSLNIRIRKDNYEKCSENNGNNLDISAKNV